MPDQIGGDDLARLRDDIAETIFSSSLGGEVRVFATGLFAERRPGFDGDFAIGFGRQHQDGFAGVDLGFDLGHPAWSDRRARAIERLQVLDFMLRVPGKAFAAIAGLGRSGPSGGEAAIKVGVIALDDADLGTGLAWNEVALAFPPIP